MITDLQAASGAEGALRLVIALLVPYALGSTIARIIFGARRSISVYLSNGFLIGVLMQVITIQLFDITGTRFSFWPMLALLTSALAFALILAWRGKNASPHTQPLVDLTYRPLWQVASFVLLCIFAFVHVWFALEEVVLRPTYAWDAWSSWEPMAIQFFHNGNLESELVTTVNHGAISTLAQLWAMLALDSVDSTLTHIPWILCYLTLGISLYGAGREYANRLWGLALGLAVLSMPLITIHTALPGYADLWSSLAFTLGVFTVLAIQRRASPKLFLLAIVYAMACAFTKRTGLGLGFIILLLLAITYRELYPKVFVAVITAITITILIVILALTGVLPIKGELWGLGLVHINQSIFNIPGIKPYEVSFQLNLTSFVRAIFVFSSWHLLGIMVLLAATPYFHTSESGHSKRRATLVVTALALALVYFLLYFTVLAPEAATGDTGLSRALLSVAPLGLLLFMLRFSKERSLV